MSQGTGQITIPDVAGTTVADATRLLKDQGLKVGSIRRTPNDTVPLDSVIRTDPAAGTAVGRNFGVVLVVSSGPKPVLVPNVLGLDATTAANQLGQKGFVVNPQSQPSDTVPVGNVISTNPGPNTLAPKGSPVTVVISTGPQLITVKDVTGETQAQAQTDLTNQGFHTFVTFVAGERSGERRQGDQPGSDRRLARHEGHDGRAHGGSGHHDHAPHRRRRPDGLMAPLARLVRDARSPHDLPWRATRDRWAVLVAEVMLQQTQVARVEQMWEPFLARFPDPQTGGRGRCRRAHRRVGPTRIPAPGPAVVGDRDAVAEHGWPDDLTELPGVGRYTAGAVAAEADDADTVALDTNIRRVVERVAGRRLGQRDAEDATRRLGGPLSGRDRLLALMDLGARVHRTRTRVRPARRGARARRVDRSPTSARPARRRSRDRSGSVAAACSPALRAAPTRSTSSTRRRWRRSSPTGSPKCAAHCRAAALTAT